MLDVVQERSFTVIYEFVSQNEIAPLYCGNNFGEL